MTVLAKEQEPVITPIDISHASDPFETPGGGKAIVFGTREGFAVRRVGDDDISAAGQPDILYFDGQSLTLNYANTNISSLVFLAHTNEDFQESELFDATV